MPFFSRPPGDSPHPRGWTPGAAAGGHGPGGFPAPAGMDPVDRALQDRDARIPRTRGDGPSDIRTGVLSLADSPHPRGWTPQPRSQHAVSHGFPAPAGMDPSRRCWWGPTGRIPRTRGDGPHATRLRISGRRDSPHPRGWTPTWLLACGFTFGFPAPAGMDRDRRSKRAAASGIPRTRGDGPALEVDPGDGLQDSPHPRGWTAVLHIRARPQEGFPAPAGMDRLSGRSARGRAGIPRTRGDGPALQIQDGELSEDSPHPRGWTPLMGERVHPGRGFPAPAGMDRSRDRRTPPRGRIPRTRGDGPPAGAAFGFGQLDSPHPRGWTPVARTRQEHRRRIPRTRGDGPLDRKRADYEAPGFPAPAGMDPRPCSVAATGWRIPRTRGDGPASSRQAARSYADSPHPRGWTLALGDPPLRLAGFPAPAGMDHRPRRRRPGR